MAKGSGVEKFRRLGGRTVKRPEGRAPETALAPGGRGQKMRG